MMPRLGPACVCVCVGGCGPAHTLTHPNNGPAQKMSEETKLGERVSAPEPPTTRDTTETSRLLTARCPAPTNKQATGCSDRELDDAQGCEVMTRCVKTQTKGLCLVATRALAPGAEVRVRTCAGYLYACLA